MRLLHATRSWPLALVVSAIVLSTAIAFSAVHRVAGDSHDATYYACLYAGSLTQVGTTEPANCGRGSVISWSSSGVEGLPGEPASMFWAYVLIDGQLERGSGVVSAVAFDEYATIITFEEDISDCTVSATASVENLMSIPMRFAVPAIGAPEANQVTVYFFAPGQMNPQSFSRLPVHVQVFCTEPAPSSTF